MLNMERLGLLLLLYIGAFATQEDITPDISNIQPVVTAAVTGPESFNKLIFYCNFTPPVETDYFYTIKWGISSELTWIYTLVQFDPMQFVNQSYITENTALTEEMLIEKKICCLGFTIACSVTAQKTEQGIPGEPRRSDPRFFGIEVSNQTVEIRNRKDTAVFIRLTAPIRCPETGLCFIDLNVHIPTESGSCRVPGLLYRTNNPNGCRLTIRSDQINEWIPLNLVVQDGENRLDVERTFDLILSISSTVPYHQFFANCFTDPIKVVVRVNMTLLKNSLCYLHSDPHLRTPDGIRYDPFYGGGSYILLRNTKVNTQVQVSAKNCSASMRRICGVAIGAGRDVFIASNCEDGKWDIRFRMYEDRILRVKMIHMSKYEVVLPTGTKVMITFYKDTLNADIAPSLADYLNTEGLCGRFDKDPSNDRDARPGSMEEDTVESWRVTSDEDLFNSDNYVTLRKWQGDHKLYSCNVEASSSPLEEDVTRLLEESKNCEDGQANFVLEDFVLEEWSSGARRKRSVDDIYALNDIDFHQTSRSNFNYNIQNSKKLSKRRTYSSGSTYADCARIFNTIPSKICSSMGDIDPSDYMENCISDAKMKNSIEWSPMHLEAFISKCIHEVKVNQRLTGEDLAKVKIRVNDTVLGNTVEDRSKIPSYPPDLLQQLQEVICPYNCNGNGLCTNGTCICNTTYIGDGCGQNSQVSPTIYGMQDNGVCDVRHGMCRKLSVHASNLANTPELTCRFFPFVIDAKNQTVTSNNMLTVPGDLQTLVEVSCKLPNQSLSDLSDDFIARGYAISVSNNRIGYSEEEHIVLFDSECMTCTKENGKFKCDQKQDYCVKRGKCYEILETYECLMCVVASSGTAHWQPNPECQG